MKMGRLGLVLLNIAIGFVLLIVFYFCAFLSGYGSNISHLADEKALFIKFLFFHLIVNLYFLYRLKNLGLISVFLSIVSITFTYVLAAYLFGYFC